MKEKVMRETATEGIRTFTLRRTFGEERFISLPRAEGDSAEVLFERAVSFLEESEASLVSVEGYGIPGDSSENIRTLKSALGGEGFPITWITPTPGELSLGGLQAWAVSGARVEPIRMDGQVVGSWFEDDRARYLRLGGIISESTEQARDGQARRVFRALEKGLEAAGMSFADVVRTWFFIKEIDDWYAAFNRTRDEFFAESEIHVRLIPASTGVGCVDPSGPSLVGGLLAVRPKDSRVSSRSVPSPLQGSPLEYGSSFSRAMEVNASDHRRLLISGTASISGDGRTVSPDDTEGQIAKTWEVVESILSSRGMGWRDVSRGIAYFKQPSDSILFERFLETRGISFPTVFHHADICRRDLLFELEADAIQES